MVVKFGLNGPHKPHSEKQSTLCELWYNSYQEAHEYLPKVRRTDLGFGSKGRQSL